MERDSATGGGKESFTQTGTVTYTVVTRGWNSGDSKTLDNLIDLSNGGQSLFVSYLCKFGTAADYTSFGAFLMRMRAKLLLRTRACLLSPGKTILMARIHSLLIKAPVLIELDVKIGSDEYGEAISHSSYELVIDVRHGPLSEESVA